MIILQVVHEPEPLPCHNTIQLFVEDVPGGSTVAGAGRHAAFILTATAAVRGLAGQRGQLRVRRGLERLAPRWWQRGRFLLTATYMVCVYFFFHRVILKEIALLVIYYIYIFKSARLGMN